MRALILLLGFMIGVNAVSAQVDTEFWFVLPEISQRPASGGGTTYDRPSRFVITTADKSATVTLSKPADNSFVPIVLQLNANETRTLTFSNYVDEFENRPANTILNKGICISATERISVYYENLTANTEIFVLKGKQALGMEFFTPFQTEYDNTRSGIYAPDPKSSFDIVATKDNTTVTITPTQDIVGRSQNIPFTINLNKGETYSAEAVSNLANLHLAGSYVISDKPIAITVKDDLVNAGRNMLTCRDLIGDQIVPVSYLGKEYIHVKGKLGEGDYFYYLSTEDNTQLFKDGNGTPLVTLMKGQQYQIRLINEEVMYIRSSAPIYVFQISGYSCEFAGALVPKLYCSGVNKISFTRPNYIEQSCNLIVPRGGENNFLVNGLTGVITAGDFLPVPGTNGIWLYAKINDNPAFSPNVVSTIENTSHIFHVSLFNGEQLLSASMCYFSSFELRVFLPQLIKNCNNSPYLLNAGPGYDSYLWSDGSTQKTVNVFQSGKYWVRVSKDGCEASDTSIVTISNSIMISDTIINPVCIGNSNGNISITVEGGTAPYRYIWSNGGNTSAINNLLAGRYSVTIQDVNNCESISQFDIIEQQLQRGFLIGGGSFCTPSSMPTLTLMQYVGNIEHWEESIDNGLNWTVIPHNQPTYTPPAFFGTKTFRVRIGTSGCSSVYSLSANVLISAQTVGGEVLPNTTICLGMRSPRFSLWNFTGEVLRWEVSKDSIHWSSLGKRGFTWYQPGTLTITTWFRVIIQNGTCPEAVSKPVRITVIRRPTETQDGGSITGTDSVCLGALVSITLTVNQAPISHWEYTDGDWMNAIRMNDDSPTINLVQTAVTDRRYRAVLTNPCGQTTSKEFTVKALLPPTLTAMVEGSCDAGGTIRAQSSEPNTLFSLIPNVQPANRTGVFEQLPYGNYTLSGTSLNGCSHFIPVEVRPTAPDPPNITQVLNLSPTISSVHWTRVRGNSITYILRYKIQYSNTWTTIGTIVDTFKVIQPLEPTTYYELQVAAVCRMPDGLTDTTAWSDGIIKGFQTSGTPLDCAPPLPLPPFPSGIYIDEITPTGAKVHWNRVLNTAGYIVSFGLVQQNPQTWAQNMVCAPDTFLILQNLSPNSHYRVRVRTNCTNCTTAIQIRDRRSNWSGVYGFDTPNPRLGEDVETFFDVKLYPNPANQEVSIYYAVPIEECATMEAFSNTGARIAEWKLKGRRGQISLDTKAWSEGVYLFRFNCNGQIYTHKLIISR